MASNNLELGIAGPLALNVDDDRAFRNGWYPDNCKLPRQMSRERDLTQVASHLL